jgi:hypothetical protein
MSLKWKEEILNHKPSKEQVRIWSFIVVKNMFVLDKTIRSRPVPYRPSDAASLTKDLHG